MNSAVMTPGEPAPDFELEDTSGNLFRLSDFRGSHPVVLVFLRGFL